jgi:DNA (cytosine-5)-methyltransferase 1
MLEEDVDESYYLTEEQIATYEAHKERHDKAGHGLGWKPEQKESAMIAHTLTVDNTRNSQNFLIEKKCILAGITHQYNYDKFDRVYDSDGISPTIDTCEGGGRQIKIIDNTKKGYIGGGEGDSIILSQPTSQTKRSRVQRGMASTLMTQDNIGVITTVKPCQTVTRLNKTQNGRLIKEDGEDMFTLTAQDIHGVAITVKPILAQAMGKGANFEGPPAKTEGSEMFTLLSSATHGVEIHERESLTIRKLTEKEYWRLMGFTDEDFDKAATVSSRSQLYKQAGNSIVVPMLEAIFSELLTKKQPKVKLLSDYMED